MNMKVNGVQKRKKPENLKNELKQSICNNVANVKRLKLLKLIQRPQKHHQLEIIVKNIV